MRIKLSHAQADPDLRFRPITKRRRLELALSFGAHKPEPDLEIPDGYPYVDPHWLYVGGDTGGLDERTARAEQRVAAEVFGREAELIVNWSYLKAEVGKRCLLGFVDVARYYFEKPFAALVSTAVRPAECLICLRHCSWGATQCCCKPRARGESRSPCGTDCMWCQLFPRDLGPLPNGLYRPTMQLVYE